MLVVLVGQSVSNTCRERGGGGGKQWERGSAGSQSVGNYSYFWLITSRCKIQLKIHKKKREEKREPSFSVVSSGSKQGKPHYDSLALTC